MADEVFLSTPCRCCLLLEDKDMVYVFDVLDEFGMKISDLIDRNGGIRILENDAFSKHICGNCLNDLAISERFFQRCQKTYDLLMKLISDDAEEEHQILLEDSEILAEAGDENVSYVIVAPGESSALFEDHTSVEENTVVNDDVRQTVDKPEPEILLKEQLEQLEDEDGDEVQIFNDTDHLKECDDIIQEEEINISDELYGQIFKTSLVTQRNNLTDDKDEGDSIVMNSDKKPNDSIMCSGDERSGSKCVNGNIYCDGKPTWSSVCCVRNGLDLNDTSVTMRASSYIIITTIVVHSRMTKCDMEEPISIHEPSLRTRKKKFRHIQSHTIS
uniref:ZAD domain-containing protein n=1 Tax=Anopheles dirus TaxID=7168 RepID=A0A182N5A4_9DIPT